MGNISLLYDEANYGGGMCVAEGLVPPLFGSPLVIKHNSAHEMGGGMFVDTMEKDTIWLHGAVFENNTANWGGASAAWQVLPNLDESNSSTFQDTFCLDCTFSFDTTAEGYNNPCGFATYPWVSKFVSECPPSADLSEDVF